MDEIAQRNADSYLHRLYSKGRVLGHKRGKRNTRPNTSLLQIEGVSTKEDAQFYLGKVPTLANACYFALTSWPYHSAWHTCIAPSGKSQGRMFALFGGEVLPSSYAAPSLIIL